ncbi:hypothetical protein [Streptomyces sp. MMG1121]|uniref:hypothetical protein n=1 Tax=Streptomyces sp. MMG1121 TaxID=1415544 RepID=UPI0006AF7E16|nr:hypothetical protein [Streptomyces sp. MMG1121]KOV58145.1 hypothetical protein ADK64_37240 [Streptomyces sp. MMG1121]
MSMAHRLALTATALALTAGLTATAAHAQASTAAAAAQPSITSVSFSGTHGPGVASPTITVNGSGFGATPPAGTNNNVTSCGTYTNNGNAYANQVYFIDDNNFEAGYSDSNGANCIGVSVISWSSNQVVLRFGNAYGSFAHWYLSNGDGYALSVDNGIFGGTVSGLS